MRKASAQGVLKLAQAAPAPATAPAEQKLLGVAAWGLLVGNSITGKEDGETLVEHCEDMLRRHHAYIVEHLEDMPEVRDWRWSR